MTNKNRLLNFLKQQRLIVIASKEKDVWIFDAYYVIDNNFNIYFVSRPIAKHSQQILKNPRVAFSTVWFDENDKTNRKAIQGQGICRLVNDDKVIIKGVKLHNKYYPQFKSRLTVDYIRSNETPSKLWIIKPSYIKFWNDKLYGKRESEEFFF